MITGVIHKGSGLGDQLFSYILTRVVALDRGYDFGFIGKEFFNGKGFMDLDWGKDTSHVKYSVIEEIGSIFIWGEGLKFFRADKLGYDPEVNFIEDGTFIDGYGAQDQRYFLHRMGEIAGWLGIRANFSDHDKDDTTCVLNVRGGEFRAVPELILPRAYWEEGIGKVRNLGINDFEFHTDDPGYCREIGGDAFPIFKNIELNWRAVRYAKHAVISNSAFGIIPRLLKHHEDPTAVTIAPHFWARRNDGYWHNPSNYYPAFTYI